jgi:hypothetical protein
MTSSIVPTEDGADIVTILHAVVSALWTEESQEAPLDMCHRVVDRVDVIVGEHGWSMLTSPPARRPSESTATSKGSSCGNGAPRPELTFSSVAGAPSRDRLAPSDRASSPVGAVRNSHAALIVNRRSGQGLHQPAVMRMAQGRGMAVHLLAPGESENPLRSVMEAFAEFAGC